MSINCFDSAEAAASALADYVCRCLKQKPSLVLGLATGTTMVPFYERLIDHYRTGAISFSHVTTFNLDEYVGLPLNDPRSYRQTMNTLFFNHVDIGLVRTHVPDGTAHDLADESRRYEEAIRRAGGIDLQILGVGRNGHIGFNEPGSEFSSRTRVVTLQRSTLAANSSFFGGRLPPQQAVTMGIGTILEAREIAVLATGAAKRDAVRTALVASVSTSCPASALRAHKRLGWWLDRDSGEAVMRCNPMATGISAFDDRDQRDERLTTLRCDFLPGSR
jgi:glucosamine-6-phosphate deaminase